MPQYWQLVKIILIIVTRNRKLYWKTTEN